MAYISRFWLLILLPFLYFHESVADSNTGFGWKEKLLTESIPIESDQIFNSDTPLVAIGNGFLRGFVSETINKRKIASFKNVPYGQPPIGPLRFQAPLKANSWNGIKDATGESILCIQIDFMTQERNIRGQEDCLVLEVHTPLEILNNGWGTANLPVMVFFHGGSFASGAAGLYGPYYLLDQNIVLVTVNYRLGPFGFLSTGDGAAYGNAGMKDQVLALKWVQENIAHFGGNANSVTIFGQSAGAAAVQHHIVSPASKGLFHRGISQSGSSLCWFAIDENARQLAIKTGQLFGCYGNSEKIVKCLKNLPAEQLVTAHLSITDWNNFPIVVFAPVIEPPNPTAFLTEHPLEIYKKGEASNVPWITGFAKYEMGWLFSDFLQSSEAVRELNREWNKLGAIFLSVGNSTSGYEAIQTANKIRDFYLGKGNTEIGYRNRYQISQMIGDRYFLKCGLDGMQIHTKYTGESVYGYEFSFEGKYSIVQLYGQDAEDWGVAHLDDVIYLLNDTEHYSAISTSDKDEYKMMQIMTSIWANFATYGIPYMDTKTRLTYGTSYVWKPVQTYQSNGHNLEESLTSMQFLDLNLNPKMIPNPYVQRYKFWDSLHLKD